MQNLRQCGWRARHDQARASRHAARSGFGEKLLTHTDDHSARKAEERKVLLQYAIKTARAGKREPNAKGGPGSWSYAMSFDDFGMLVCTDRNGDVEDTFTFFPDEKKARGRQK